MGACGAGGGSRGTGALPAASRLAAASAVLSPACEEVPAGRPSPSEEWGGAWSSRAGDLFNAHGTARRKILNRIGQK